MASVLVIGDVMTDIVARADGPIAFGADRRAAIRLLPGGSGANQAAWLAAEGADVVFAGRVGRADREHQAALLSRHRVRSALAADGERPTGTLVTLVSADGERSFLTDRAANENLTRADIPDALLDGIGWVHVSGYAFFAESPRTAVIDLLGEARRRSGGERWPKLVHADYREIPYPDASFDAAVNLFTSLGYLGDEQDTIVLTEIGRVLRPGGRLVIETLHRDQLVRRFTKQDWRLVGEGRLLLEQRTFDPASGVAQTTQTVIDSGGERDSRVYSVRVYTATELVAMLSSAGFAEARCYGGLDGESLGTDTRLVIVAQR